MFSWSIILDKYMLCDNEETQKVCLLCTYNGMCPYLEKIIGCTWSHFQAPIQHFTTLSLFLLHLCSRFVLA